MSYQCDQADLFRTAPPALNKDGPRKGSQKCWFRWSAELKRYNVAIAAVKHDSQKKDPWVKKGKLHLLLERSTQGAQQEHMASVLLFAPTSFGTWLQYPQASMNDWWHCEFHYPIKCMQPSSVHTPLQSTMSSRRYQKEKFILLGDFNACVG